MTLEELRASAQRCPRCVAPTGMGSRIIFGEGKSDAKLMLVSELPGEAETQTGLPVAGRAGGLLDKMLAHAGLRKSDIFITTVLQCCPPDKREPTVEELKSCCSLLFMKVSIIRPKLIVALGRVPAQVLLNTKKTIRDLRQSEQQFQGMPVVVTYSPSSLIYDSARKSDAWEDFAKIAEKVRCFGGL